MDQDSVGGKVECAIIGLKPGLGEPFFDSIESHLSSLLFSIPAVKSVAFGNDKISELFGSEANDCYYYQDALVKTTSNNNGGITGGISNGMPVVFTVGIKPTPSISKEQKTIDVKKHENTTLGVHGRHDPCIVFRATVVVEAMAALAMLDLVREFMKDLEQCRREIDEIDQQLIKLFEQRMNVSKDVVTYKLAHGLEIFQPEREKAVIEKNAARMMNPELADYARNFMQDVMDVGKSYQATFIPLNNLYNLAAPKRENIKVGYAGVPGAFAHQAMLEYFGNVENTNYVNFRDVFEALKNAEIDYGIVPLENSST